MMQETIEQRLTDAFDPLHLEVVNESDNHSGPSGRETHFKVVIVSEAFASVPLVARHRMVNRTLADQLAGGVHALAMHTYTEADWRKRFGEAPMSPPCAHS
ncbi:MAG: BolA/IbaG family iron-sulfur metabolism protein [Gammaproteobacteria bacterium]|nr:BolA/IbaG family iron-sulfur metabolism protein [Gammaproteobacteria bacterium]MXY50970.1 BolA/IbaG family iron-sulfur metabolism protein [Gammaproteobacteria bacterium]